MVKFTFEISLASVVCIEDARLPTTSNFFTNIKNIESLDLVSGLKIDFKSYYAHCEQVNG